jgi:hypothetical protein
LRWFCRSIRPACPAGWRTLGSTRMIAQVRAPAVHVHEANRLSGRSPVAPRRTGARAAAALTTIRDIHRRCRGQRRRRAGEPRARRAPWSAHCPPIRRRRLPWRVMLRKWRRHVGVSRGARRLGLWPRRTARCCAHPRF